MLKELISLYIAPLLKRLGFKKKGSTWNMSRDGFTFVFDIQSKKGSKGDDDSFTINLGVFVDELWRILWDKDAPAFVKEEQCYPRFRLGYLLSGFDQKRRDKWWNVESKDQLEEVAQEIEGLINELVVPTFESLKSVKDSLDLSIKVEPSMPLEKISHAVLLKLTGDEFAGIKIIESFNEDLHWGAKAREVSERISIN